MSQRILYAIMLGKSGLIWVYEMLWSIMLILFIATTITFTLPNTHVLVSQISWIDEKILAPPIVVMIIIAWLSLAAFDLDSSAEFIYFDF